MTEEIDYQALYEQLSEENRRLRLHILTMASRKFDVDGILNAAKTILQNGYFWCGYFVAIIVMLFIGVFKNFKGV